MDTRFSRWLTSQMKRKGMTAAALADAADLQESTVSRWRNRGTKPDAEQIHKIANVFGVEPLEIFVAAEYLSASQAKVRPAERAPEDLTIDELLDLIREKVYDLQAGQGDYLLAADRRQIEPDDG